jgi:hypothetical protein
VIAILQMKAALCQLWRPGLRYVLSRIAGRSGVSPLRYLGFQGLERGTNFFPTVTQITSRDGHTDVLGNTSTKGGPYPRLRPPVASTAPACPPPEVPR